MRCFPPHPPSSRRLLRLEILRDGLRLPRLKEENRCRVVSSSRRRTPAVVRDGGGRCRRYYHELSFKSTSPSPVDALTYNRRLSGRGIVDSSSSSSSSVLVVDDDVDGEEAEKKKMVRIEMHSAPWNPADANVVQGKYASPYYSSTDVDVDLIESCRKSRYFPDFNVAGSEGIGRVAAVSTSNNDVGVGVSESIDDEEEDNNLRVGDWVTFGLSGLGTMRSSLWVPRYAVLKIKRGDELMANQYAHSSAACLFQLGGTAMRLLKDHIDVDVVPTERPFVILQNAGNSAVGFMISHLAKILYPQSYVVSFVRRGPHRSARDMEQLVEYLSTEGNNDMVVVEEDVIGDNDGLKNLKRQLRGLCAEPPVIAFNAVGGESSTLLLKLLGRSSVHVTYGAMSKQPVTATVSQLVFKDTTLRGYWHSAWMARNSLRTKTDMANELVDLVLRDDEALQCPPVKVFPLSAYKDALEFDSRSDIVIRRKVIFDCRE